MNISYLENLKKKPVPQKKKDITIQINVEKNEKKANAPDINISQNIQEKIEKPIEKDREVFQMNETITEKNIKKNEKEVKIVDKRNIANIDRNAILNKIKNVDVVPEETLEKKPSPFFEIPEDIPQHFEPPIAVVEKEPETTNEEKKKEPIIIKKKKKVVPKKNEPIQYTEAEEKKEDKTQYKEAEEKKEDKPQYVEAEEKKEDTKQEPPTGKKPKEITIKKRGRPAKTKTIAKIPVGEFVINDKKLGDRLPKPREKFIYKASSYYMNNRKIFIEKLNDLFKPYRKEIAEMKESVSCESRNNSQDIGLLTHQKIVRDYLNLYTPYRGLLLYHGLGSGKTCASISIAEGMKSDKKIIIMTPASLKMNFFSELKKCGDHLFRKNQYWEYVSIEGQPDLLNILSSALNLSKEFIFSKNGAWLVDISKPENFSLLSTEEQLQIDEQLDEMIRSKYQDINYNGMTKDKFKEFTKNEEINPFDNSVVIIDEAHNFVSRIVNKIKQRNSISYKLYELLLSATNSRIVLLSGTPIINYPNEIGILYNILRGYIKTWIFTVNVKTNQKINRDIILDIFENNNLKTYDYVEYSGNKLTITKNPFGFINNEKRKYTKKPKPAGGNNENHKTHILNKKNKTKKGGKKTEKNKTKKINLIELKENEKDIENSGNDKFERDLNYLNNNITFPGIDTYEGGANGNETHFELYNGVKLDPTGNISDDDFVRTIKRVLLQNDVEIMDNQTEVVYNKALPDKDDAFLNLFIEGNAQFKNQNLFKRRILGLTSYFRSAQEQLLPRFIKNERGENIHLVECEMSDYQFGVYSYARIIELEEEEKLIKQNKKKKKPEKEVEELYKIPSSYKIRSRSCCNFAFPEPPGRPLPDKKDPLDALNENAFNAVPAEFLQEADDYVDEEDVESINENESLDYRERLNQALKYMKDHSNELLSEEGLKNFSPKFLNILRNVTDENNIGLHLIYSQFRTVEGVALLKLVLEEKGFVEFKIEKNSSGQWLIKQPFHPQQKRFLLYTGTETREEKEILRNIYNGQWEYVPSSITSRLKEISENNNYGEIVKIMMITSSGAEGINLRNTRFVHIVEAYWHMVRMEQVIGRARRICSHQDLPVELRTVKVFLYLSTLSEEQLSNDKNKQLLIHDISKLDPRITLTTDEKLYEISRIKNNINEQILKLVKESAMDCSLYASTSDENLVCYGYGKINSNVFGSFPSLEEDNNQVDELNVKKEKIKLIEVTVNGVKYAYERSTGNLYDIDSYKRSKITGENLIFIGKLRINKDGKGEIV